MTALMFAVFWPLAIWTHFAPDPNDSAEDDEK